jgi:hypothetical protein
VQEPHKNEDPSLEIHDFTREEMDEYQSKELFLPHGGELVTARVINRTRDGDGLLTGYRNSNPILDTRKYDVKFPDGSVDTYTANVIAENLSNMIDPEGQQYAFFKGIGDHRYVDHQREMTYIDDGVNQQPKIALLEGSYANNGWMGLLVGSLWLT